MSKEVFRFGPFNVQVNNPTSLSVDVKILFYLFFKKGKFVSFYTIEDKYLYLVIKGKKEACDYFGNK